MCFKKNPFNSHKIIKSKYEGLNLLLLRCLFWNYVNTKSILKTILSHIVKQYSNCIYKQAQEK